MIHPTFRGLAAASLVLALAACDNGETTDDPIETDSDTTGCSSSIDGFLPAKDATGVYYRTPIEITFGADESSATVMLMEGETEVTSTVSFSADGTKATIEPSAPLTPSTTYTISVDYSCGAVTSDFTTSNVGSAITADDAVDLTYNIDLSSGRITEPPGVGDLLLGLLQSNPVDILVGPSDYDGEAMEMPMLGALGTRDGGSLAQDECEQSINFPIAADFSANPYFEIGGDNVTLAVAGVEVTLATIFISGAFAPDLSEIVGVELSGEADTRDLDGLIDGVDDICATVAAVGVSCIDCEDGEQACLAITADSITAEEVDGVTLMEITPEQAEANCSEGGEGGEVAQPAQKL